LSRPWIASLGRAARSECSCTPRKLAREPGRARVRSACSGSGFASVHPRGQPLAVTPIGRCVLFGSRSRDPEQALSATMAVPPLGRCRHDRSVENGAAFSTGGPVARPHPSPLPRGKGASRAGIHLQQHRQDHDRSSCRHLGSYYPCATVARSVAVTAPTGTRLACRSNCLNRVSRPWRSADKDSGYYR